MPSRKKTGLNERKKFHKKFGLPFVRVPEEHFHPPKKAGMHWLTTFQRRTDTVAYRMQQQTNRKIKEIEKMKGLKGLWHKVTGKKARMIAELQQRNSRISQKAHLQTSNVKRAIERAAVERSGIFNRVTFSEMVRKRITSNKEHSVIMFDIDNFKSFNDTYGHEMGNRPLQALADALKEVAERNGGIPCRYGGEEFVLYFPKTGLDNVSIVRQVSAAFLKNCRKDRELKKAVNNNIPTISAGASELKIDMKERERFAENIGKKWTALSKKEYTLFSKQAYERLMKEADKKMYNSKEKGRNRFSIERNGKIKTIEIRKKQPKQMR